MLRIAFQELKIEDLFWSLEGEQPTQHDEQTKNVVAGLLDLQHFGVECTQPKSIGYTSTYLLTIVYDFHDFHLFLFS